MSIHTSHKKQLHTLLLGILAFTIFGLTACVESNKKAEKTDLQEESDDNKEKSSNLFAVEGKVFSIPSPIQTALLLKSVGTDFNTALLNPVENEKNYSTSYVKALNLGIYAADLGYSTIYDQSQSALSYMAVTQKLSNDMGISGVFDKTLIQRFENSIGNQDSLLALVAHAFKKTDRYLKDNKQKDVSVMVLAGGWIETLHLATSLVGQDKNETIKNRIGEQKITVKNLINLLLPYRETPVIGDLLNHLNELKDIYADINFTYNFRLPETIAEKKLTIIKSESTVEINEAQLKAITEKISEIRKGITN